MWSFDGDLTTLFHAATRQATLESGPRSAKKILVTGAGSGSIGRYLLRQLLQSGARVVVGTGKFNASTARKLWSIYRCDARHDAQLILLPFNQGSRLDVEVLVAHIYNKLGWDLDCIIPFAAIPQTGQNIEDINGQSELAQRIMLTNTVRLLGCVSRQKRRLGIETNPALVLLPLSPNHGEVGHDGLYAESKLGLESLLRKWHAEA